MHPSKSRLGCYPPDYLLMAPRECGPVRVAYIGRQPVARERRHRRGPKRLLRDSGVSCDLIFSRRHPRSRYDVQSHLVSPDPAAYVAKAILFF